MATSKSLKTAVKKEVKQAEHDARTGNVATIKETKEGLQPDQPTGARSHPEGGIPR
jgi:hypothetical protein